jgi:soluble lytic murein transglycosylase-like protein|tara:strand:+ start:43 stop:600 length:558 start_codon:yes stop_codon:yes gene_type:complete
MSERELPMNIIPPAEKPDVGYNPNWKENPTIKSIIKNDPIIERIIMAESSGRVDVPDSPVGARGLMQIMKNTAERDPGFGVDYTLSYDELSDPVKNVQFGSDYFKGLRKYYGNNKDALIAYNWGHGNYQSFRDLGYWIEKKGDKEIIHKTLPKETRDYVTKILGKEKHTGGMIQRNPYPYNPRPI